MGDAGAMFTIQDLMTAVQEQIPIILMIFNDQGLRRRVGATKIICMAAAAESTSSRPTSWPSPNHSVPKVFFVDDLTRVGATLESALDRSGPVLIEVPNQFDHPGYGSFGDWSSET